MNLYYEVDKIRCGTEEDRGREKNENKEFKKGGKTIPNRKIQDFLDCDENPNQS